MYFYINLCMFVCTYFVTRGIFQNTTGKIPYSMLQNIIVLSNTAIQ